jgi:two-component system, LytTR family, response regulator
MMRILLVDDEPLALERLTVALAAVPDAEVVGTACDGIEAEDLIAELNPDLLILDIQMPGLSGMELAESLAQRAKCPEIIFVTAFNSFALDAFNVDAADYLLKPVSFDRLRVAIERVGRRLRLAEVEGGATAHAGVVAAMGEGEDLASNDAAETEYPSGIWVPGRQGSIRVPVSSIERIEAARDYVLLNTPLKSYILRAKMTELEQRIDPREMIRVHRSHMVRIDAVTGVERPGRGALRLLLNDGTTLQVGPNYQSRVVASLGL